jgi:hypothetical protein
MITHITPERIRPAGSRPRKGLRSLRLDGKPEPLIEIAAADAPALARLAWHFGNRHTAMQVIGERLRIRRDPVLEAMLTHLGALDDLGSAAFRADLASMRHESQYTRLFGSWRSPPELPAFRIASNILVTSR